MTLENWNSLLRILESIQSDFRREHNKYKNGSNQKIRKEAFRQISNSMVLAKYHVWKYQETVEMLLDNSTDPMHRAEVADEFRNDRYFDELLTELIEKIKKEKIN